MATGFLWFLAILNGLIWLFNAAVSMSDDRSGSGMVLMITLPISIVISLVSALFAAIITNNL